MIYRLAQIRYLTAALTLAAALLSLAFAALIAWRNLGQELLASANRAVFNADRLLDRTVKDLEKLDALRGQPCDASVIRLLQDVVYDSLSQIREVGLVRDGRLYCTNFGPTAKEVPIRASLTEPGVHVDVAPNTVVPNNFSLFIYVSREKGTAVNALFNPQVLAEFERDFAYVGDGRLALELRRADSDSTPDRPALLTVYTVGEPRVREAHVPMFQRHYESTRGSFVATAEASSRAWMNEVRALLPLLLVAFGAIAAFVGYGIRRWLARGNLDRLRYLGALQRGEFVMHYQPIVDAANLKIVGVEALLRWQHPNKGLLRAAQFIDIFGHDSIAAPLTRQVIDMVGRDLQRVPAGHSLWCAINIAPSLLEDNRVLDALSKQILSIGKHRVQIEITERAPLGDYAEIMLHEMRSNGIKVGMDDLGTGYANLSQLQRMPFDFIKIDGMLVRGIHAIEGVTPVVKSLIDLARRLGSDVVVEGVETKVQADALILAGATHLQGYYFDAARPIDEVIAAMRRQLP
jgi:c-di-GMP phosphodiesterase